MAKLILRIEQPEQGPIVCVLLLFFFFCFALLTG